MLHVWEAPLARATKDLDFLGRLDNSRENLDHVVREICRADVEPDGMVFDPATVKTERIKEDADYEGVRVRFVGLLGKARIAMQLDVRRRRHASRGGHHVPGAVRLPRACALGLPARDVIAEKRDSLFRYGGVLPQVSPRDRRERGRAVLRGAHRARSALSASRLESGATARAARDLLGRNGEAPSERSLGASVYRPSSLFGDERKMAPTAGLEPDVFEGDRKVSAKIGEYPPSQNPENGAVTAAFPLTAAETLAPSEGPRPNLQATGPHAAEALAYDVLERHELAVLRGEEDPIL